jgi:hypothetical protein
MRTFKKITNQYLIHLFACLLSIKYPITLIFLFINLYVIAQEWSEPVVINPTQSDRYSDYPSFCIDNEGHIHCVWSTVHGSNFYRIWYSKSEDGGETWTVPYNASQNNYKWMTEPQIVSDNEGMLHLTYEDEAGSLANKIIYKTNDGNDPSIWSESDTLNEGYFGAYRNRLVIDHNDRLYIFWYVSTGYGKMYYRHKDVGLTEWSDVIMPYDTAFFYKIVVGTDNSLNIAGTSKKPSEIKRRVIYYKYYNLIWKDPEIVSPQSTTSYLDLSLDTQDYPHIVWMQYSPGNGTGIDSTLYRYKNQDGWQSIEFIHSDVGERSIVVDNFDNRYIIEADKWNDIHLLTEYKKTNEQWVPEVIEENDYGFSRNGLICKNNFLYIIYVRVIADPDSIYSTSIIFRKKEVFTTGIKNNEESYGLKLFPNPFKNEITFNYTTEESQKIVVRILDQNGFELRLLFEALTPAGKINLTWDGNDNCGGHVKPGIYFLCVEAGKNIFAKKLILH